MCSLSKEEFLGRAPPFMGDILWAHLEILQKDVEKDRANIENVPSNFPETATSATTTFNVNPTTDRLTYTNLEPTSQPTPPPTSSTAAVTCQSATPRYTTAPPPLQRGPPMGSQQQQQVVSNTYQAGGDYNSTAGSTVDTSSEYSYHGGGMGEVKYSQQQQQQMGRVPTYPPPPQQQQQQYQDQTNFSDWNVYAPPVTSQHDSWHQPSDFHSSVVTSSSIGMHHHPAFLQVLT